MQPTAFAIKLLRDGSANHSYSAGQMPPETARISPVMYDASSLARNRQALATSAGSPRPLQQRFRGVEGKLVRRHALQHRRSNGARRNAFTLT